MKADQLYSGIAAPERIADLRVPAAGHLRAKAHWIHERFDLHAIGFIVSGDGTYQVDDGAPEPLRRGSVFAVYPGPTFHYGPTPGTTWQERFVCVTGPGVERWIKQGWLFTDGCVRRVTGASGELTQLHDDLLRVLRRGGRGDVDRGLLLAERWMTELHYAVGPGTRLKNLSPEIEAVLSHCRKHFTDEIDFEKLADRHAMSYSHLRQSVRRLTGSAPAHFVMRLRCEAACALLAAGELSIKQVATRVGIGDPYSFSRTFKRCLGISPQRYRDQIAAWARPR